MIPTEDLCCLALAKAPGVGPVTFRRLVDKLGSARAVFSSPAEVGELVFPAGPLLTYLRRGPDPALLSADLDWLEQPGHHLLCLTSSDYPPLLAEIADPPPVLFVQGDIDLLLYPQVAVVGSRNPTPGGKENAYRFSRLLSEGGFAITSGMAQGIDAESHLGALDGTGKTIAVTGCGLDRVYPKSMLDVAIRIAQTGALVSEFPVGTPPDRKNFPKRNRIISGLSSGVLVVEASLRSGSLITARLANEQGREVFAIPGSINNPLSKGCHALIRQGARLVESAEEVGRELGAQLPVPATSVGPDSPGIGEPMSELLSLMGFEAVTIDTLVNRSGLSVTQVSSLLLQLELDGLVSQAPGGRYLRR